MEKAPKALPAGLFEKIDFNKNGTYEPGEERAGARFVQDVDLDRSGNLSFKELRTATNDGLVTGSMDVPSLLVRAGGSRWADGDTGNAFELYQMAAALAGVDTPAGYNARVNGGIVGGIVATDFDRAEQLLLEAWLQDPTAHDVGLELAIVQFMREVRMLDRAENPKAEDRAPSNEEKARFANRQLLALNGIKGYISTLEEEDGQGDYGKKLLAARTGLEFDQIPALLTRLKEKFKEWAPGGLLEEHYSPADLAG